LASYTGTKGPRSVTGQHPPEPFGWSTTPPLTGLSPHESGTDFSGVSRSLGY